MNRQLSIDMEWFHTKTCIVSIPLFTQPRVCIPSVLRLFSKFSLDRQNYDTIEGNEMNAFVVPVNILSNIFNERLYTYISDINSDLFLSNNQYNKNWK